jgi:allantoin racemase
MKIMVVHVQYPPAALKQRQNHVLECASPGTEIAFSEIKGELFKLTGNTELLRMVTGPQVVEKAKEAERQGFDAVVPYGGLDLGVDAARHYVDIPVVGMGRSALALAATMATRIAVLVYANSSAPAIRKLVREAGFTDFVCAVERIPLHVTQMTPDNPEFRSALVATSRQIVEAHSVEAIVPFGTSLLTNLAFTAAISNEVGVPFIDSVAAGIKTAEVLVGLGLGNSRAAYPSAG